MEEPKLVVTLNDGTPFTMYIPSPKQRAFHENSTTNLLAVGNRGGGKSVMLRFDAHMRALSYPGINLILVRKSYKELLKSHIFFQGLPWGSLKKEMELLGGTFHATDYICHYPNGSKLFLSYVGHEGDALNLLSAEFAAAYYDEISTIPWDYFLKLSASVRVPRAVGLKAVVRAATNPLGPSASDVMKYFVSQDVDPEEDPDYDPLEWGHIKVGMEDNPHLDVEQYRKRFAGLSDHVKKAWLYGEFSEEAALFDFRPTKEGKPYHVIHELDIPSLVKSARIFRVLDWGWSPDPCYCAWIAHLGNRYIVFHEKLWYKTIVPDVAADILTEDRKLGITRVVTTYCDPTLDFNTGAEIRTNKGIFESNGIPMDCSVNSRELYASMMHMALAEEVEPDVPRLQIFQYDKNQGAPYLIKALPLQRFDEKKPMAMANQRHDHPVVAVCYFLISQSSNEHRPYKPSETKRWLRPKQSDITYLGNDGVRRLH